MTPLSLLQFCEALFWCALLLTSIAGFGALLLRGFGLRRPLLAIAATTGFGVVLALGGLSNLAHLITRPALLVLIALGLVAAAVLRPRLADPAPNTPFASTPVSATNLTRLFLFLFTLVFVLRVAATVHWSGYQNSDDFNFYLGEPLKTLQLHFYAPDPFSERRIMASIGGSYFLQTLILTVLPLENVQMADRTLGLLLTALCAWAIGSRFRLTPTQRALFALLVLIIPQLSFNLSFVILPSALLFGMVLIAADSELLEARPTALAVLLGLITAASASLKNTYLPHPVFFVLAIALFQARRRSIPAGLRLFLIAGATCFLAMAPWMYAGHQTSGTWFYPSLGPGFHYTAYGIFPKPSSATFSAITHRVLPFCLPIALVWLATWLQGTDDEENDAILALMAATTVAALLIGLATGGESIRRYNYPAMVPSLVLLFVVAARRLNKAPTTAVRALYFASIGIALATSLTIGLNGFTREFHQIPVGLALSLRPYHIVPLAEVAEYQALQAALPPRNSPDDAPALVTVRNTFLLDFRAHTLYVADIPGGAGLPPGWPNRGTGEDLARYLLTNRIRYLIYDYSNWAYDDQNSAAIIADHVHHTQWIRDEHEINDLSHKQYRSLARTHHQLYNDGKIFLLDLATPTP